MGENILNELEHVGVSAAKKAEKEIEKTADNSAADIEKETMHEAEQQIRQTVKVAEKAVRHTITAGASSTVEWGKDIGEKAWEIEH